MKLTNILVVFSFILFTLVGCQDQPKDSTSDEIRTETKKPFTVKFDADSAYRYVQEQVDFGPRVPGTGAHGRTALYLQIS